jgi:hypothetical protein
LIGLSEWRRVGSARAGTQVVALTFILDQAIGLGASAGLERSMINSPQFTDESRAGDGAELTVTQARSGVRRGVSKVLVISTLLAIVGLGGAWFLTGGHTPLSTSAHALALRSEAGWGPERGPGDWSGRAVQQFKSPQKSAMN